MPAQPSEPQLAVPLTSIDRTEADGVQVFCRTAGDPRAPVVLLLHGFPTSSFMFRELIPRLARDYRVIAPDLPGFGFTEVPADRSYTYTFSSLAVTMDAFTRALEIGRHALYVFDYGPPSASAWPWLIPSASPRSFHRTGTRTRRASGTHGGRSGATGRRRPRRTARRCATVC